MIKIGIVFGSGGARGIAHILMVDALEELGLKPSAISGSSNGSCGGFLCCWIYFKRNAQNSESTS